MMFYLKLYTNPSRLYHLDLRSPRMSGGVPVYDKARGLINPLSLYLIKSHQRVVFRGRSVIKKNLVSQLIDLAFLWEFCTIGVTRSGSIHAPALQS
eukprot:760714-Hanusia_phi.AAC.4